jgi:hypothetical protein
MFWLKLSAFDALFFVCPLHDVNMVSMLKNKIVLNFIVCLFIVSMVCNRIADNGLALGEVGALNH